jgi:putative glutamine amidotransferase
LSFNRRSSSSGSARCAEDKVIEALEGTLPGHYVLAVQWHPERGFEKDESSRRLFQSFIEAARRWRAPAEKIAAK